MMAARERVGEVKQIVAQLKRRRAQRAPGPPRGLPALGPVRQHRQRQRYPGQVHHGQAGPEAVGRSTTTAIKGLACRWTAECC